MAREEIGRSGGTRITSKRSYIWVCEARNHFCGRLLHRPKLTLFKEAFCHECDGVQRLRSVLE